MTTIDELLVELLERRAAGTQPGSLLAEIVREAGRTPQRGRATPWTSVGSRLGTRLAVAAWAVVLVLAGGLALARPAAGPGATLTTPSRGPSPSASPSPGVQTTGGPGIDVLPLAGGTWETTMFAPALRFTVSDGTWAAAIDAPRQLLLRARLPGAQPTPEFDTLAVVVIENVYDDPCRRGPAETRPWDAASGPAGFLDWLEASTGSSIGPRTPVEIMGASGLQVAFSAPDLPECAGNSLVITDAGGPSPFRTNLAGTPVRYAVIDLRGRMVLVATWAHEPGRVEAVWAAADAVLSTMVLARPE